VLIGYLLVRQTANPNLAPGIFVASKPEREAKIKPEQTHLTIIARECRNTLEQRMNMSKVAGMM
jgi:hypothetical protein